MAKKKLSILGSTGSIGVSTLDVVRQFPDQFEVVGLAAGNNVSLLKEQILEFQPSAVSLLHEDLAARLKGLLKGQENCPEILFGPSGYETIARLPSAQMVVSAMVGAAGLLPTLAAIEAGKDIALANKETLVVAGELVMEAAGKHAVEILPVDSEHSAIFQSLQGNQQENIRRILLPASGGPFFTKTEGELTAVTPEAALCHPNWSMGRKITIDSATLMNKGLEVIEAHWLFGVPVDMIAVHIHPESIIHSMVEYIDGSVIAQLGIPDMKIPIAYALAFPHRLPVKGPALDLFHLGKLSFFPPDMDKFPCLRLAYEACRSGSTLPCVLNAANEVAVQAFLDCRIGFTGIPRIIETIMSAHTPPPRATLESLLTADRWARQESEVLVQKLSEP